MTDNTFSNPWPARQFGRQDAVRPDRGRGEGRGPRRDRSEARGPGERGEGLRGRGRRHLQEHLQQHFAAASGYTWAGPQSDGEEPVGGGRGGRGGGRSRGNPFGPGFGGPGFGGPGFGGPGFPGFGGPGFPGFGGPFGRGRRGGGRARRGDVRAAALILLGEEPRNGYQLIQELANRSDGMWKPSPGAVYPALQQLEDEGLIRAVGDDGRKAWELTPAGREYLDANRQQFGTPWELQGNDVSDGIRGLAELGAQVGAAVMQVAHAGDDAQIAKAAQILTETRRSLYRLLADDEPTS
jgi:DNA-binding PadR family transcriptional regulator